MRSILFIIVVSSVAFIQAGCHRKRSEKPEEVYRLWAGQNPPPEVKVLNGRYWQSAHFTKEYIVYMELSASREWIKQFIDQNKLQVGAEDKEIPGDAPAWFKPPSNNVVLSPSGFSQGSRYFIDSAYTHMFLYEVQL